MALNLWKLGGQPTSYNPLTTLTNVKADIGIGEYIIQLEAKSGVNGRMRVWTTNSALGLNQYIDLTTDFKLYEFSFSNKVAQGLYMMDINATNNIEVKNVKLVEKPLPKLTINGIDGFKSGKWTLHANATVIDDETLELNATSLWNTCELSVSVPGGQDVTFSNVNNDCLWDIDEYEGQTLIQGFAPFKGSKTWKLNPRTNRLSFKASNDTTGKFTFKKPMLNLGTIPAPYSKKTGERMVMPTPKKNLLTLSKFTLTSPITTNVKNDETVNLTIGKTYSVSAILPIGVVTQIRKTDNTVYGSSLMGDGTKKSMLFVATESSATVRTFTNGVVGTFNIDELQLEEGTVATAYEPYAVQLNPKPKVKVPRKNLLPDFSIEWDNSAGVIKNMSYDITLTSTTFTSLFVPVRPNQQIIGKVIHNGQLRFNFYKADKSSISNTSYTTSSDITAVTPSECYYVKLIFLGTGCNFKNWQLEEGSNTTPYEPYQLVLPKARTGMVMDGISNYVQLPSMTMDAIEIDCLIDSVQLTSFAYLFDARGGIAGAYVRINTANGLDIASVTGMKTGERTKIFITANSSFTDDVNIFSRYTGAEKLKGILYSVKCYLNGQVVASYDFTNPNNIVGDKILNGTAKNLIPSFEDSKWSLHSNFKVLGKDVGRLDASGINQITDILIDVIPNKQHLVNIETSGLIRIYNGQTSGDTTLVSANNVPLKNSFTPTVSKILVRFFNGGTATGSFDFIKPQLYQLDGKEGTIYGSPSQLNKPARRVLYARR